MAERPTKRERRELARKSKLEEARRRARKRRKQRLTSALSFLVVAAIIGALIYMNRQADQNRLGELNALATSSGCTAQQTHPDELAADTPHATPPATVDYKTNPPTSGAHYGNSPVTGIFSTPRQNEAWVHSLEHGHVAFFYKDTLAAPVKSELEKFVQARNTLAFMQPRPENPETLVMIAWTKSLRCQNPTDPKKIAQIADLFFKINVGHGPEGKIPGQPNQELPGTPPVSSS